MSKSIYSEKEYSQLLANGKELMKYVLGNVNNISSYFIHKDKVNDDATYRREDDFKEICVSLDLYDKLLKNNKVNQTWICNCNWDYVTGESPNYFCGKCGKPMGY
jgi:hypothetical protein